jgi:hypothetical protein
VFLLIDAIYLLLLFLLDFVLLAAFLSASPVRGVDSPTCCAACFAVSPISRAAPAVSSTLVAVSLMTPRSLRSLAVSQISIVVSRAASLLHGQMLLARQLHHFDVQLELPLSF